MNPKILTFDIETSPNLCFTWGFYEQNVIKVVRPWYLLTVGYKWLDEAKAHVLSLPDFKTFKTDVQNDKELAEAVWKLLDKADIVITQNGDAFDIKKLQTRFLLHGLPPPSPFKSVDTKKTSKKHFSFVNNKLDNLGEELGLGGKMHHEGFELWEKCMHGDPKAFKKMAAYNKRDVILTEKVYLAERPYMSGHPNLNAWTEKENCKGCQSPNVQFRGFNRTKSGKVRRFQCQDCGMWGQDTKSTKVTAMV
jgi:DNA polymerase elongation subunit (family B)